MEADGISCDIKKNILDNSVIITLNLSTGDALIYSKTPVKGIRGQAMLTHEIFHAVSYILRNIGINHSVETEEVYAYILEDVLVNVFTWLSSELHEQYS